MSSHRWMILFTLFLLPAALVAQDDPLATGERCLGMGGAWIANGHDVSVTLGNPALLGTLGRGQLMVNGVDRLELLSNTNKPDDYPAMNTINRSNAVPLFHGVGAAFRLPLLTADPHVAALFQQTHNLTLYDSPEQDRGEVFRLSFAMSATPLPGVMLGIGTSREFGDTHTEYVAYSPAGLSLTHRTTHHQGHVWCAGGIADLAALTKMNLPVTLGISYRFTGTREEAEDFGDRHYVSTQDLPAQVGAGVAWKPATGWIFAADVQRTFIADSESRFTLTHPDSTGGMTATHSSQRLNPFETDGMSYRFGVEYRPTLWNRNLALRAGLVAMPTYDGTRIYDDPSDPSLVKDPVTEWGRTLGLGLDFGRVTLDMAWYFSRYDTRRITLRKETDTYIRLGSVASTHHSTTAVQASVTVRL